MKGGRLIDKLSGDEIYGIYQTVGGCWFDSVLMCIFISDSSFVFDPILKSYFGKKFSKKLINNLVNQIIKPVLKGKKNQTSSVIRKRIMNIYHEDGGLSYSEFMDKLKKSTVVLNRKVLADIAMNDPESFKQIIKSVS